MEKQYEEALSNFCDHGDIGIPYLLFNLNEYFDNVFAN